MNQEELKTLVAQMLRELAPQPEPQVKGSEYRPTGPAPGIRPSPSFASGPTTPPHRTAYFLKSARNLPGTTD